MIEVGLLLVAHAGIVIAGFVYGARILKGQERTQDGSE